jgi:serine phosphatase RsbU (regulator of sigma subunit)
VRQMVEIAWESLSRNGEELCGDCVKMTSSPDSFVMVLSDGLGSGVKANILATLTAQIASSMFEQGAMVEEVMETLVETLPECKIRKLAYATFSMLKVIRGREAYLVEYDSPPLIHIRNGEILHLPMKEKVVNGRTVREANFSLQENDTMVVVTDGYVHAGVGGLYRLGWGWDNLATSIQRWTRTGGDSDELCRALSRTCRKLYDGKIGDDATAVCMRIRPSVSVNVWSGPPARRESDEETVKRFMSAEGGRVI